jgi:hypothetical protein
MLPEANAEQFICNPQEVLGLHEAKNVGRHNNATLKDINLGLKIDKFLAGYLKALLSFGSLVDLEKAGYKWYSMLFRRSNGARH